MGSTTAVRETLEGSAFALARWFQPERYADRPEDDETRDEILGEVWNAEALGVSGSVVLAKTPKGACAIEKRPDLGVVVFDFVSDESWTRTKFWMNASSVADLGDQLRRVPRRPFDELFVGSRGTARTSTPSDASMPDVPEGHYAVETEEGHLAFYEVDRPTEGRWAGYTFLNVLASDERHPIKGRAAKAAILAKIAADVPGAMARYGQEIGSCGRCNRTLTDETSRAYGIGPECRKILGLGMFRLDRKGTEL